MKSLLRLAAMICNAIEFLLLRMIPTNLIDEQNQLEQMEREMDCPQNESRISFYFLVRAQRFNACGMSTQTRAVEIAVDPTKYTKYDAQAFAAREFVHLDDSWTIRVTPMTYDNYLMTKAKFDLSMDYIKGPSEPHTKTNS